MRIAYLVDPTSPNGRYRGVFPMTALGHYRGHAVRKLFDDDAQPVPGRVDDVDLLFIHRYSDSRAQQLARDAHAAGAAVVWDNDDDMGAMPKKAVNHRYFGGIAWERRLGEIRRIFRFAHMATAPNRTLAERLHGWGAPHADIVENHVPDQCVRPERRPHEGIIIGWIAGLEHTVDLEHLPIAGVLQRILDEREDVRVVTVGIPLNLRSDRYRRIPSVPLLELTQQAAAFDIALAPLADSTFNRSRSNVKLKEYAAAGTPWLASPIGPYAGMGERQGGRLVPYDGWYEAITHLIDRPRERRKLAKRAARWGAGEALSKNVVRWERMLEAAVQRATAAPAAD